MQHRPPLWTRLHLDLLALLGGLGGGMALMLHGANRRHLDGVAYGEIGAGILLLLLGMGLTLILAIAGERAQQWAHQAQWHELGRALGLRVNPQTTEPWQVRRLQVGGLEVQPLRGEANGLPVEVRILHQSAGDGYDSFTVCQVRLPLGEYSLQRPSLVARWVGAAQQSTPTLKPAGLGFGYQVSGRDSEAACALLARPGPDGKSAQELITDWQVRDWETRIEKGQIELRHKGEVIDPSTVGPALAACLELAGRLRT